MLHRGCKYFSASYLTGGLSLCVSLLCPLTGGSDVQHREQYAEVHSEKSSRQTSGRQTQRAHSVVSAEG